MPRIDESDRLLAHGQAALVLVEGALLVLIEAGILDKDQMLEAIETAICTVRSLSGKEESHNVSAEAIGLLSGIANSLSAARSGGSASARVTHTAIADPPTDSDRLPNQVSQASSSPG